MDDYLSEEEYCSFVDLGLHSGILWSICNLGALSPDEFGDYFKTNYRIKTYNYCKEKYINQHLENHLSIPSKENFQELLYNTTRTWIQLDEINGLLFTSIINGNRLFIPAAGTTMQSRTLGITLDIFGYLVQTPILILDQTSIL